MVCIYISTKQHTYAQNVRVWRQKTNVNIQRTDEHVCVHVCVCVCVCIYTHTHTHSTQCVYLYTHTHNTHTRIHPHTQTHIWMLPASRPCCHTHRIDNILIRGGVVVHINKRRRSKLLSTHVECVLCR